MNPSVRQEPRKVIDPQCSPVWVRMTFVVKGRSPQRGTAAGPGRDHGGADHRASEVRRALASIEEELIELVTWLVQHRAADLRTLEAGLIAHGHRLLCQLLECVVCDSPAARSRAAQPCPGCQRPMVTLGPRAKRIPSL